jgi:hypothetical protein
MCTFLLNGPSIKKLRTEGAILLNIEKTRETSGVFFATDDDFYHAALFNFDEAK